MKTEEEIKTRIKELEAMDQPWADLALNERVHSKLMTLYWILGK